MILDTDHKGPGEGNDLHSGSKINGVLEYRRYQTKKHPFPEEILSQIKSLYKLDNYHGILALLQNYLIVTATIGATLLLWNTIGLWAVLFYPIAVFVIGSRQRAFATLLHEASHGVLAKNKRLNFVLATYPSAYLVLQTFYRYKKSHCQEHHRYLGDVERDPDLRYYVSQGLLKIKSKKEFIRKYLLPNWLFIKLPYNLWYLLKNRLLVPDFKSQPLKVKREYYKFMFLWGCLITVLILTGTWIYFLLFWVVPLLTTFQALNCTIEVCEHYPLVVHSNKEIYMTRNRNGNWIEKFFTGMHEENYHLIHHLFTGIPFWNLKRAHAILLQDNEYRFIDRRSGGIITKSQIGGKTIIEGMFELLYQPRDYVKKNSDSIPVN